MNIIITGAPGSGKSTQSQFIINKYCIPQISTGQMLRDEVTVNSKIGIKVSTFMNFGKLVPDDIVIKLFKKRIKQKDCVNGFLLDGFPRTIYQAQEIKNAGIVIDYVIALIVPDSILINRIIDRRVNCYKKSNDYIKYNSFKYKNIDEKIDKNIINVRTDDQEDIIKQRLIEYNFHTKPLLEYYHEESKINNVCYFTINGIYSINYIKKKLISIFR